MDQQLIQAAQIIESQLDAEIEKLDNLDDNEIEQIRKRRIESMKAAQVQKIEWERNDHGKYTELADEKEFFEACKKSKHIVCHFYRESTMRCKIVDKHLAELAPKHMECRFIKINAEKVHFLIERLKIKIMPTMALIKENKPIDYIVGFADLGNTDDFSSEMLEWRIATTGILEYNGDLLHPPIDDGAKSKKHINTLNKQAIIRSSRTGRNDDEDDEDGNDW